MKERAFNARPHEVRAMLDGSLTQFRRIVKPQPNQVMPPGEPYWYIGGYRAWPYRPESRCGATENILRCPYGQPGDRLFVREAWSTHACFDHLPPSACQKSIHYWADGEVQTGKCRPSIHMPRAASRITLEVVSRRVERLQDITNSDARAEGVDPWTDAIGGTAADRLTGYRLGFRRTWEQDYGHGSWDANHWVWVVEVKRVEGGAA